MQSPETLEPWNPKTLALPPQAEAERRLLEAALAEAANQRFLLASESCTPIYPPHVVYAEALAAGRSRVDACKLGTWQDDMRRNLEKCAPSTVLCELIGEPIKQSAKTIGEPIKGQVLRFHRRRQPREHEV